jgi:hypothetical protein
MLKRHKTMVLSSINSHILLDSRILFIFYLIYSTSYQGQKSYTHIYISNNSSCLWSPSYYDQSFDAYTLYI